MGVAIVEITGNMTLTAVGLHAKDGGGWTELLGQAPDLQRQDTIIVVVGESERGSDDSAFVVL